MSNSDRDGVHYEASTVAEWLLLGGNRLLIAGLLSVALFSLLLGLDSAGVVAFQDAGSVTSLGSGMVAGTFTTVTIVLTINQLVLSREFTTADEFREKLDGVLTFHEDVKDVAAVDSTPFEPTAFLGLVATAIAEHARQLASTTEDGPSPVREYANAVADEADELAAVMDRAEFGTFNAIRGSMTYDDAWQIHAGRRLRSAHADELSSTTAEALDDLLTVVFLFSTAQSHFKSTYLQRELALISRHMLYVGLPAVVAAFLTVLVYADLTGPVISAAALPVVVSALMTVVFSPLAVLAAYMLRTGTVARRTAAVGPIEAGDGSSRS